MNIYEVRTKLTRDIQAYQLGVKFRERLKKEQKMTPEQRERLKELVEDIEVNFNPYING